MALSYRDVVSLVQLIFFAPCIFLALYLAARHGWGKASGWIYLAILSLLRVVGSVLHMTQKNTTDKTIITIEVICSSIGLSPLALMLISFLSRANEFTTHQLPKLVYRGVSTISIIGVVLSILGATKASKDSDGTSSSMTSNSDSKIGVVLYALSFAGILILLVIQSLRARSIEKGEKRLLLGVAVSAPFYLIRLIYSLVGTIGGNANFNILTGNVTIYLVMAVIEEFAIVLVCIGIGMTLRVVKDGYTASSSDDYHMEQTAYNNGNYQYQRNQSTQSTAPMQQYGQPMAQGQQQQQYGYARN